MKAKVVLLAAVFVLSCVVGIASAFDAATVSFELTDSGRVFVGEGYITYVKVLTDGVNNATVILYDNATAAEGKKLDEWTVVGADNYGGNNYPAYLTVVNGCYASVSGTGASVIVGYIKR